MLVSIAFEMTCRYHHSTMRTSNTFLWVGGLGLFLATLDTGIINIALPALQTAWHVRASEIAWTVAAYTLTLAGTVLFWGHLADGVGPERVFVVGLTVFGLASGVCGAAPALSVLVGARAVQGLGSAMIQGTAVALATTRLSPDRRALALGTLALFQGLGPVLGPTVGGVLLTWLSWRWLFWINLPVTLALIGVLSGRRRNLVSPRGRAMPAIDWTGSVLLMGTVTAGLLALASTSDSEVIWAVLTAAMGVALFLWERRTREPLVPRALWGVPGFWAVALAVAAVGGATALGFMVPPYTLRLVHHFPPWAVGVVNMAAPLALVVCSRPASRWIPKVGPVVLMGVGLAVMAGAFASLAIAGPMVTPWVTAIALLIYGVGAAAFFPANLAGLLDVAGGNHQGVLGALQRMGINLGTAVDATVTGALLSVAVSQHHPLSAVGVRAAWAFGAGTLVAAGIGLWATGPGNRRLLGRHTN